jgi:hypothetical protein
MKALLNQEDQVGLELNQIDIERGGWCGRDSWIGTLGGGWDFVELD